MAVDVAEAVEDAGPRLPMGKKLRALRVQAGLSIPQLAALTAQEDPAGLGVHRVTLNRIELDMQTARAETAALIAAALSKVLKRRITMDTLFTASPSGEHRAGQ